MSLGIKTQPNTMQLALKFSVVKKLYELPFSLKTYILIALSTLAIWKHYNTFISHLQNIKKNQV